MSAKLPRLNGAVWFVLGMAGLHALDTQFVRAETIVLHLRNGDRVAGTVVAADTNRVVLATSWIKELPVPLSAIQRRETVTNAPPPIVVAGLKPPVPAPTTTPPATEPPKPKRWKASVSLGTDVEFGAHDRELFYGRANLTYERPYKSAPKKVFRSILDYAADYGKTDGLKSADRMDGSVKTDFDIGGRVFVYNLAGAGYDEVRKIDLQYEVGPGAGYHLFTRTNFVMNVESGLNYQVQERAGSPDVKSFYFRLAEDFTWRITPRVTLVEKAELFPKVNSPNEFRARLDATLSFGLWQNLALKLSVLDLYDTDPAEGVAPNDVQIRSSLEIIF